MEPISLKVKDFYTLANGEINFTKFSSALILGYYENNPLMSNGSGKSAIFEAICWAIFNETRQTKVDDVIRWTSSEALVEFEFMFGRSIYKITRRRSRVAKESSVSFFTKEGDRWVNDSGSTNSETDKKILQLLRIDAKIFLNSVYFKQDDISLFANANPSERKKIIKSIMKLERWDEYQKEAKNKLRVVKDEIEKHLRTINENNNLGIATIVNGKSIDVINDELKTLVGEQKMVHSNLNSLYELKKERNLSTLLKSKQELENEILRLKSDGKKLQGKQFNLNELLTDNIEKSNEYIKQLSNADEIIEKSRVYIESLKKENCLYQDIEDIIVTQRVEKGKLENTLDELKETASMVGLGQCQVCLTDITENNLSHIHENRKQKKETIQQQFDIVSKKLEDIELEYKTRKSNREKLDKALVEQETQKINIIKLQTQKRAIDDEIILHQNENIVIDTSIRALIDQIRGIKIEIEALNRKIEEQKIHNIDVEIMEADQRSKELLNIITSKNIELGTLLKESEFLLQRRELVDKATENIARLGKEKVNCDQLVRFFGKEGIQAVFIESVVDELEQYANTTLSYICNEPTIIKLKTQKKTGDSWQETLEIDVIMNGFPQTFESLGGGERFRISLALRIGLSEVLVKRAGGEIKLLLLDEVDSPLDAYGLNNLFENIIKGLEKRFKILVISHSDKLKDRFNDTVVVKKTSNGSFISQT